MYTDFGQKTSIGKFIALLIEEIVARRSRPEKRRREKLKKLIVVPQRDVAVLSRKRGFLNIPRHDLT